MVGACCKLKSLMLIVALGCMPSRSRRKWMIGIEEGLSLEGRRSDIGVIFGNASEEMESSIYLLILYY
jgi:hypothetical protein